MKHIASEGESVISYMQQEGRSSRLYLTTIEPEAGAESYSGPVNPTSNLGIAASRDPSPCSIKAWMAQ